MKTIPKIIIVFIAIILVVVALWLFLFKSEETGPVYAEVVSEDGLLKLTTMLEKSRFTTSPREAVRINLTLMNIGDQEITLTFRYKTVFDFMIFSSSQGSYTYMWSWEHIQGAQNRIYTLSEGAQKAWDDVYNYSSLEPPEMNTVTLKPGEGISQLLTWNQNNDATGAAGLGWLFTETAPKGVYKIEGYAGHGNFGDVWTPENPLRFFEYALPDGRLVSTVLKTPTIEIKLV